MSKKELIKQLPQKGDKGRHRRPAGPIIERRGGGVGQNLPREVASCLKDAVEQGLVEMTGGRLPQGLGEHQETVRLSKLAAQGGRGSNEVKDQVEELCAKRGLVQGRKDMLMTFTRTLVIGAASPTEPFFHFFCIKTSFLHVYYTVARNMRALEVR